MKWLSGLLSGSFGRGAGQQAVRSFAPVEVIFDGFEPEKGPREGDRCFAYIINGERLPAVTNNPDVIRMLEGMKRGAPLEFVTHFAEGPVERVAAIKPLKLETVVSPRTRAPATV